jgi:hypothetical protein
MVDSTQNLGDGVVRNTIYAKWREDKPAEKGYSQELLSVKLDAKYFENISSQVNYKPNCLTFLDYFELNVKERRNEPNL